MKPSKQHYSDFNSLRELIVNVRQQYSGNVFIRPFEDGIEPISYEALGVFIDNFGAYLADSGIAEQTNVCVALPNSTLMGLLFLATIANNRVFVPVHPMSGSREITHILELTEPRILFCKNDFKTKYKGTKNLQTKLLDNDAAFIEDIFLYKGDADDPVQYEINKSTVAEILFTSGSTGLPKGVVITHQNILSNSYALAERYGLTNNDNLLAAVPLFHAGGQMFTTMSALWHGSTITIVPPDIALLRFWNIVDSFNITWSIVMTAFLPVLLARDERSEKNTVIGLLAGGSGLSKSLVEKFESRFGIPIYQVYGLTETTAVSICEVPNDLKRTAGSAGKPLNICELIIEKNSVPVENGEEGEILLKGPHVFKGYLKNKAMTEEKISGDFIRSGDIGVIDGNGNLIIKDRIDNMIIVGGENIYPAEIESLAQKLEGVEEIIITSIPHRFTDNELVLVYKLKGGQIRNDKQWNKVFSENLSSFKIPPKRVNLVDFGLDDWPRTSSGKISRPALSKLVNEKLVSKLAVEA